MVLKAHTVLLISISYLFFIANYIKFLYVFQFLDFCACACVDTENLLVSHLIKTIHLPTCAMTFGHY